MSDLTTRLSALGIEPGEAVCGYELRAQESSLIPRLSSDAALYWLVGKLEEVVSERDDLAECASMDEAGYYDLLRRAEQAEAERDRLQHFIDCADTPLMRDVMAERDRLRWMLEQAAGQVASQANSPGYGVVGETWEQSRARYRADLAARYEREGKLP